MPSLKLKHLQAASDQPYNHLSLGSWAWARYLSLSGRSHLCMCSCGRGIETAGTHWYMVYIHGVYILYLCMACSAIACCHAMLLQLLHHPARKRAEQCAGWCDDQACDNPVHDQAGLQQFPLTLTEHGSACCRSPSRSPGASRSPAPGSSPELPPPPPRPAAAQAATASRSPSVRGASRSPSPAPRRSR